MERSENCYVSFTIKVSNLPAYHVKRLKGLLKTMEKLGSIGASRKTSFFSDGDGDFRPKFSFEEHKYEHPELKEFNVIGVGAKGSTYVDEGDDPFYN